MQAGHQVVGLARSDASAAALEAAGADVRRGDLDDLDSLTDAASHADGVILGVQLKEIATTIGEMLHVPTNSIPLDELDSYFGFLSGFITLDAPISTAKTQALLGWTPVGPSLIDDLKQGHYFVN